MSALLFAVLAAAPLTLSIDSPQKRLYVGEPWKLVVTWTAGPMRIADLEPENADFERGSLVFHVDDGSGERPYAEGDKSGVISETIWGAQPLPAGQKLMRNLVLQGGWYAYGTPERYQGALFPRAGRYTVRAQHRSWALVGPGKGRSAPVFSKRITVEVNDPPEEEQHVLKWMSGGRRNAWVAMAGMGNPEVEELDRLIAENPRSRYLLWPRLQRIRIRSTVPPVDTIGRERSEELRRSDPRALRRLIGDHFAGLQREATSFDGWGIFQEDALAFALTLAPQVGDEAAEARLRAEVRDRFPRSATAHELERGRLAEQ
jgi:hypothetical protein